MVLLVRRSINERGETVNEGGCVPLESPAACKACVLLFKVIGPFWACGTFGELCLMCQQVSMDPTEPHQIDAAVS
ncbi:unnamed protein product [Sphenostylis stenocarpa]|uniref:Uncharacterized protein n=1 Tax=Sphenostylis stenocarpa TaxID=92480 RepID=A0AA86SVG9_9FABA|nr:unnamed protein product [Sphenostylis stenocarpa]